MTTTPPTPTDPTPATLLANARDIADRPSAWGSCWPRAAAILARQALEDAIDRTWTGPAGDMRSRSWADKLTCLPWYTDPDLARRARHTWHALSTACHAHPYELAPTAGELHGWIAEVEGILQAVCAAESTASESGRPAAAGPSTAAGRVPHSADSP